LQWKEKYAFSGYVDFCVPAESYSPSLVEDRGALSSPRKPTRWLLVQMFLML